MKSRIAVSNFGFSIRINEIECKNIYMFLLNKKLV